MQRFSSPPCFFVCTSLLFHPLTAAFATSSLQVQDPAPTRVGYLPTDRYWGFPVGATGKGKGSILLLFPPQWNRSRWPSSPCSFSPRAKPVPYGSLGQTPRSGNHQMVPNHIFFHFPLLALLLVVKHWTQQLYTTPIPALLAVGMATHHLQSKESP